MVFFDLKAVCAVCNKDIGLNRFQIANKEWLCKECFKSANFTSATPIKKKTIAEIRKAIQDNIVYKEELSEFEATKKIGSIIEFDDTRQKILVYNGLAGRKKSSKIYNYSDIIDFELLEDGETITKGGLGSALVGGALFGGVGAVVGGVTGGKKSKGVCSSLKIKITINDILEPAVYLTFLATKIKKSNPIYQSIYASTQECLSTLQLICRKQEISLTDSALTVNNTSNADEILKYKELMDKGIISGDQFEQKKKQLLGL